MSEVLYEEGTSPWIRRGYWIALFVAGASLLLFVFGLSHPNFGESSALRVALMTSVILFAVSAHSAAAFHDWMKKKSISLTAETLQVGRQAISTSVLAGPVATGPDVGPNARSAFGLFGSGSRDSVLILGGSRMGAMWEDVVTVQERTSERTYVIHTGHAFELAAALQSILLKQ